MSAAVFCPRCKSTQVTRSRHRIFMDLLRKLLHQKAMRCTECRNRFYVTVAPRADRVRRKQRGSREEQVESGQHAA